MKFKFIFVIISVLLFLPAGSIAADGKTKLSGRNYSLVRNMGDKGTTQSSISRCTANSSGTSACGLPNAQFTVPITETVGEGEDVSEEPAVEDEPEEPTPSDIDAGVRDIFTKYDQDRTEKEIELSKEYKQKATEKAGESEESEEKEAEK